MLLDVYVIHSWSHRWCDSDFHCSEIVFKHHALNNGFGLTLLSNLFPISSNSSTNGIVSQRDLLKLIYTASGVDKATSVCIFKVHRIAHEA